MLQLWDPQVSGDQPHPQADLVFHPGHLTRINSGVFIRALKSNKGALVIQERRSGALCQEQGTKTTHINYTTPLSHLTVDSVSNWRALANL